MLENPLICGTICEFLWRMSSDHSRLHNGSIINGRLTGICNPGISVHAGRKMIIYVPLNQLVCPNPSVQWNPGVNQFHSPMQKHQLRGQGSPRLYQRPVERPPYSHTKTWRWGHSGSMIYLVVLGITLNRRREQI